MPWMQITCKCGHTADIDAFTRTPVSGDLPAGTFQCPSCGVAWQRRAAPGEWCCGGKLYIPGPIELVGVDSRM